MRAHVVLLRKCSTLRLAINIQMITTSEIKVTVVIDEKDCTAAVQCLHEAFQLAGEQSETSQDRVSA